MVSPAKYIHKHAFSDIFPAFCTHITASVAPLLIFYNNNDRKGESSSKIPSEEIEVLLKTSANVITIGGFFQFTLMKFFNQTKTFQFVT